jgi:hypothetical protein
MTQSIEGAQAELTPAGRDVSREEERAWLKPVGITYVDTIANPEVRPSFKFDPRTQMSPLALRLLLASNAFHNRAVDGTPASEAGTTRHSRFAFHWGR